MTCSGRIYEGSLAADVLWTMDNNLTVPGTGWSMPGQVSIENSEEVNTHESGKLVEPLMNSSIVVEAQDTPQARFAEFAFDIVLGHILLSGLVFLRLGGHMRWCDVD